MTSAAYDLLYLNFKLFILLANDSINFSPLKDLRMLNLSMNLMI